MPALDFKEIPEAHIAKGQQDTFEMFARDFLELISFEIELNPSRGADEGKDIIATEHRNGTTGTTSLKWLVSCKHKAHSGASVTPNDEINILERVKANSCDGFLGIYSTLPSTGLSKSLQGLKSSIQCHHYDKEMIETILLGTEQGHQIARRYFQKSYNEWANENPKPAKIFGDATGLQCEKCAKNLLKPTPNGLIVFWRDKSNTPGNELVQHISFCCFGQCDNELRSKYHAKGYIDSWDSLEDCKIPVIYLKHIISMINRLNSGTRFSSDAFEEFKDFILNLSPHVFRNPTKAEEDRIRDLMQLPSCLGGLG